jgi:hypothetical protein
MLLIDAVENKDYNEALIIASELGYLNLVKLLLKCPEVSPASNGSFVIDQVPNGLLTYRHPRTPLTRAVKNGHFEVVDYLLGDPRTDEHCAALCVAIMVGPSDCVVKFFNRFLEEPSIIGYSKERQFISKKIFYIGMLEVPEELNDVILHYLFKDLSIFPVYDPNHDPNHDPNNGSCCIL